LVHFLDRTGLLLNDSGMDKKWNIHFCEHDSESCPVIDFIENCSEKNQAKIFRFFSLLEETGPVLPRPYSDILCCGIHELRVKLSGNHGRFLYFFYDEEKIIMFNAFYKTTDRVPDIYMKHAQDFRNSYLAYGGEE